MKHLHSISIILALLCISSAATAQEPVKVTVRQSKAYYRPFEPIALEIGVSDAKGEPVCGASFSVSVCSAEGDFVAVPQPKMKEWLQVLPDTTTYSGKHPKEQFFRLGGQVLDDFGRPRKKAEVILSMYNDKGDGRHGEIVTDNEGRFTIESLESIYGTYYAQFTVAKGGKRKWSRIALDRNFAPPSRNFSPEEMTLTPPREVSHDSIIRNTSTFEWTDRLSATGGIVLDEAKVKDRKKYHGFTGNRYTYQGGERAGQRRADAYLNVVDELEKRKDMGEGDLTIWELLERSSLKIDAFTIVEDTILEELLTCNPPLEKYMYFDEISSRWVRLSPDILDLLPYQIFYEGVECLVFVNNKLICFSGQPNLDCTSHILQHDVLAEEFTSAVMMKKREDWMRFVPADMYIRPQSYFIHDGRKRYALFLYERPDLYHVRSKIKGVEKRIIKAFDELSHFHHPRYIGVDTPTEKDQRRTLYWNPSLITGEKGKTIVSLFANAQENQHIRVSVRGITPDGTPFAYETGLGDSCASTSPTAPTKRKKKLTQERVYLHLDNNAYQEGDSIWFQAYMQDAQLGRFEAENDSRVLYVDLLDDEGNRFHHKILEIDDQGLASGHISLDLPVRHGYYEIRAYTRHMLNWGGTNYFSRVIPVFERVKYGKDGKAILKI